MFRHNRLHGLARTELFENRFDGNSCAGDDGFSHHDFRLRLNLLHVEKISRPQPGGEEISRG